MKRSPLLRWGSGALPAASTLAFLSKLFLAGAGIFVVSALFALAPALACVWLVWWMDRHEREPLTLVALTFLWGALAALGIALFVNTEIQVLLVSVSAEPLFWLMVVVAPVVEELAKALGVRHVASAHRHEFDGLLDGLVYGSIVGFGFGATEDIVYLVRAAQSGSLGDWASVGFMRSFVFITGHAAYSACFGIALGFSRYASSARVRRLAPWLGLGLGIFLHSAHNFFVSSGEAGLVAAMILTWTANLIWLLLLVWALARESRWISQELAEEVENGVLLLVDARTAARTWGRFRDRRRARRRGKDGSALIEELHHSAAELALARRRERISPGDAEARRRTKSLRERCRALSRLRTVAAPQAGPPSTRAL